MPNVQLRLIDLIDDMSHGKDVFFRSVCFVEDIMTQEVKTLLLDDTIGTCLKFMNKNRIRHIPVIENPEEDNQNPYLIGIASQRDVFRQISPYLGKLGQVDSDLKAVRQPLVQIITRDPKSVSLKTPIADAIALMVNNRVDTLPVLADQTLLGIITSTDILKFFIRLNAIHQLCCEKEGERHGKHFVDLLCGNSDNLMFHLSSVLQTVEDIMTEQVVCLDEKQSTSKVIEVMQEGIFRHVPIVGKERNLIGIISDRDVLRHLPFHSNQLISKAKVFRNKLFDVAPNEPVLKQSTRDIMTNNPVHILPNCDFHTAVKMLYELKIGCLPVVDDKKNIVGIVTVTDVMRGLLAVYALLDKANS